MDEQLKKKGKVQDLFLTFLRIGAFTFGGGYAMIPLIHREMVDQKKWITEDEMMDMVAISESTPGPIAINAATFVGAHVAGKKGAVAATAGVCIATADEKIRNQLDYADYNCGCCGILFC